MLTTTRHKSSYARQITATLSYSEGKNCLYNVYTRTSHSSVLLWRNVEFIKLGVLPELLGKFYSGELISSTPSTITTSDSIECWCYCKGDDVGEMIGCDNPDCKIAWFHTACLHTTRIPKCKWYCRECSK